MMLMKNQELYLLTTKVNRNTPFVYPLEAADDVFSLSEILNTQDFPKTWVMKKVDLTGGKISTEDVFTERDLEWKDLMPSYFAVSLFSENLKSIVEKVITGKENVTWLEAPIRINQVVKIHYILCFNEQLDVLNLEKTTFAEGTDHVIEPCFSKSKIEGNYELMHNPFSMDWQIPTAVYVTERLKSALEKAKISGIGFEKVLYK